MVNHDNNKLPSPVVLSADDAVVVVVESTTAAAAIITTMDDISDEDEQSYVTTPVIMTVIEEEEGQQQVASTTTTTFNKSEIWNLSFCLLSWAFTICNVTLVVGTSNVTVLSISDGDDSNTSIASLPLAAFMLGSSCVSFLGLTQYMFRKWGRQVGFVAGIGLSLIGTLLGSLSLYWASPVLNIVATAFFGMATGIGFFLRFAAIELVNEENNNGNGNGNNNHHRPSSFSKADTATSWVIAGGVLAAFAGPESAHATVGLFDDDNDASNNNDNRFFYLGIYMMTGIFNVANLFCILLVRFPSSSPEPVLPNQDDETGLGTLSKRSGSKVVSYLSMYLSLLQTRNFLVPMLMATLSWAVMVLPMSLLRVAMAQTGYSSRQSLLVIELHFCGMYATGFLTGRLIRALGAPRRVCAVGGLTSLVALAFNLAALPRGDDDTASHLAFWFIGLTLLGMGWNFGFTGATVWLNQIVGHVAYSRNHIQAANDSLMFLIAGACTSSASYIYDAGGSGIEGWRTLNKVTFGLVGVFALVLLVDVTLERRQRADNDDSLDKHKDSGEGGAVLPSTAGDHV